MKLIDLLNKIANGEEVPKKIRIDHWCYNFEWVDHLENYYDKKAELDLMEVLSMSEEELNYGVEIIEEPKEIENPKNYEDFESIDDYIEHLRDKIVELIDVVNELKKENK